MSRAQQFLVPTRGVSIPTWRLSLADLTFTPFVDKRATSVFATSPLVQGAFDGSGIPDVVSLLRGDQISRNFYATFDGYQGTCLKWWTPELSRDVGHTNDEYVWYVSSDYYCRYSHVDAQIEVSWGGQTHVDSHTAVAGTTYLVSVSGDCKKPIDSANHIRISINDTHNFGATTKPTADTPDATIYLGSDGDEFPANAILEGTTWLRRILYDGLYGVDVGNGDEINRIYAAGAGADPCLITGSWDVVFCLPTNSTAEALETGTGEAWSHPHSSNEHEHGWFDGRWCSMEQLRVSTVEAMLILIILPIIYLPLRRGCDTMALKHKTPQ